MTFFTFIFCLSRWPVKGVDDVVGLLRQEIASVFVGNLDVVCIFFGGTSFLAIVRWRHDCCTNAHNISKYEKMDAVTTTSAI